MPALRPRHDADKCAKCRKPFQPGDRLVQVFIVQSVGFHPEQRANGAWLSPEFELAHVMCDNPGLDGQIIVAGG